MKKNGVFLFVTSHLVPEIFKIFVLCKLGTDDVIRCDNMEVIGTLIQSGFTCLGKHVAEDLRLLNYFYTTDHEELIHPDHVSHKKPFLPLVHKKFFSRHLRMELSSHCKLTISRNDV